MAHIRSWFRKPAFWVASVAALALAGYLAFGVFGVHTAFIDVTVNETFAPEAHALVSEGTFGGVAHDGTGLARVFRDADGRYTLRLEQLDVFNGPALRVYALAADDAADSDAVQAVAHLDLGPLKGNRGNQSYALPADFDPTVHRAITVWCERFSVNFATAPLIVAPSPRHGGEPPRAPPGAPM